jgi:hypothetical protein
MHLILDIGCRRISSILLVSLGIFPVACVGQATAEQAAARVRRVAGVTEAAGRQPVEVLTSGPESDALVTNPSCQDGGVPPAKIKAMIEEEAAKLDADAKLATAISEQESGFGQNNNSPAGARGPMQLIASTAAQYGVTDICDSEQNIRGGIRFMRDLNVEFGGNILLIVAAYNAGQKRVYQAKGIPPISETVNYVARVINSYYNFDNALHGGKRAWGPAADVAAAAPNAPKQPAPKTDSAKPVNATRSKTGGQWVGSVFYVDQGDDQ